MARPGWAASFAAVGGSAQDNARGAEALRRSLDSAAWVSPGAQSVPEFPCVGQGYLRVADEALLRRPSIPKSTLDAAMPTEIDAQAAPLVKSIECSIKLF